MHSFTFPELALADDLCGQGKRKKYRRLCSAMILGSIQLLFTFYRNNLHRNQNRTSKCTKAAEQPVESYQRGKGYYSDSDNNHQLPPANCSLRNTKVQKHASADVWLPKQEVSPVSMGRKQLQNSFKSNEFTETRDTECIWIKTGREKIKDMYHIAVAIYILEILLGVLCWTLDGDILPGSLSSCRSSRSLEWARSHSNQQYLPLQCIHPSTPG